MLGACLVVPPFRCFRSSTRLPAAVFEGPLPRLTFTPQCRSRCIEIARAKWHFSPSGVCQGACGIAGKCYMYSYSFCCSLCHELLLMAWWLG